MSVHVRIEADHGAEILTNHHPDGKRTGGNTILAFLTGLSNFCSWIDRDSATYKSLIDIMQ